ncbi:MAG: thiamine ABC transporter substrate-binding protein [Anaerolineaceae bacterium]
MMKKKAIFAGLLLLVLVTACGVQTPTAPVQEEAAEELIVMTHDSFAVSAEVIAQFESENKVKVQFVKGGDAGAALNRLILTSLAGTPEADVFFGLDNTFLSRALENDLFEPYAAPALAEIPANFKLDPQNRALPIDYGDVCINYDKAWFVSKSLPLPQSLADLTMPIYEGLLVVENPATSSPGLSFFLASVAEFGESGWQTWWQALRDNGVVVVSDWETAYYTNFSASSGRGSQPMVVSYATSPAAELIYAETPLEESPTGSIVADGTCWRQIEFAGILKGSPKRALAEKLIDFMLSKPFQEDVPLQMFVFPVLPSAALPEEFTRASAVPAKPASLDPQVIAAQRDAWLRDWTDLMLK